MNSNSPRLAAVILAAGASTRMGRPKALLEFQGETFLDHWIGRFASALIPTIAVLGHDAERIAGAIKRKAEATLTINPDPSRGQLSSLQCGLSALAGPVDGVFFTPVDTPAVSRTTIAALRDAFTAAPAGTNLVIPRCGGRHGHPVLMSFSLVPEFLALSGDATARDVIHGHRSTTLFIDVDDAEVLRDVDTPDDYEALSSGDRK